ncbi:MAG: hypothetical protein IKX45_08705 [Bacteroidales bacterium]|nr:hypothetical protein [Bacteroidales bacterium]
MRKNRIIFLFAAIALLAGCAKEEKIGPVGDGHSLTVSLGQTKTHMENNVGTAHKIFWSNGDKIRVNGNESAALDGLGDDVRTATFEFATPLSSTPYNIIYPSSIYTDETHVTLPAVQDYRAGGFAEGMYPMAGYSADGSTVTINHLCSIIKVSVKRATGGSADTDNLVSVTFKGKNNEQVSGSFTVNYSGATLTGASAAAADKEVRVVKNSTTSTSTAVDYYIVVPAQNYTAGFDIIIQDVNGDIQTKSAGAINMAAGKMYTPDEFAFEPTGMATGIEIATAEDLIAFATAYNNNEYAELGQALIATITSDIAFDATTSAAFNGTNGIGTDDNGKGGTNHFNGIFNGGNHIISGLEATVPMFSSIGANGTVSNLTLDNTCSFAFTHANTSEGMFGAIAGYHKGTLDNVKAAADVSLVAVADVTEMTTLGGLVGYANGGKLQNGCEYSGLISTPDGFKSTGKLIIGGMVGRFKNSGSIADSNFKGAINNAAQITSTDVNNPYLIIGGIAGYVDGGASVTSCTTTTEHADVASAYDGFNGKIVNKTTIAYHSAQGGIVGELNNGTVSSCTNAATIATSIFKASADTSRYMKTGGIVGKSNANGAITGCTNNGSVQHRSNPKYQDLGGIAGYNAGTITDCTNNAAINQMSSGVGTKAGRYVCLGGVIGENIADNKVSNVHNTANVEISSLEDNTISTECLGGVIGYNKGIIVGGDGKDVTNSGQVYHSPYLSKQLAGYYVGGIAGLTTASIKNAKNTGRPYFRWQGTTLGASNVHLGGIAGKAEGASSTIENCDNVVDAGISNSAQVYLYAPGNSSHNSDYIGGIVGLTEATDPVKNCTNGGEVRTAAGASTTPVTGIMMGGVIGKMTGSGEVNNADNSGRVRINFTVAEDGHSGNYLGGIVGYVVNASDVTVTGCDNSGNVDVSNSKSPVHDLIISGVVGRMDAPGTISNCNNNGGAINMAITAQNVAMNDLYVGGLLGKTEQEVTITGCSNTGAISGGNSSSAAGNSFYIGGIAAYMKGASKILNCSNTGSTVSTQSGNNDSIGSTTLTGGIVGYVEGTSEHPIEIGGTPGCTVNTTAELSATRGWIGGVAAYAKYVQISNCTLGSIIGGGCAARGAGGIVGKAEYCTISSSSYNGDTIKANQIQAANGQGGIVGYADNSTINGCSCYATKFYNNNSQPFGGIVGVSNANNTIQNCHYKSAVEGPTAGNAVTATIAGTGTFSGSGNVADL